ncbi:transposase [Rhizobium sp. TRM96647]|uniref:Transposase n=1 Tax=Labrys neptuniae TaxID=376174 RepID=A0ABV6ZSH1_9HYPH|nr:MULTISPECIES: transposase [Rhizobiaceae]MCV3736658.1 transposase [Rhizobium sp. TRM96647]MCV3759027.1 transposase [Rhizobium sp. TRM96650]
MIDDVEPERGLGHMSISQLTLTSRDEEPVRRFEVFTGNGRRREWSGERKAEIVAESYERGVTVCAVARRHGLTPQQLFSWRRLARKPLEVVPDVEDVPMFAPAVLDVPTKRVAKEPEPARASRKKPGSGAIELEIGGAIVRIASGADAATIAAVIQAVKAQS